MFAGKLLTHAAQLNSELPQMARVLSLAAERFKNVLLSSPNDPEAARELALTRAKLREFSGDFGEADELLLGAAKAAVGDALQLSRYNV